MIRAPAASNANLLRLSLPHRQFHSGPFVLYQFGTREQIAVHPAALQARSQKDRSAHFEHKDDGLFIQTGRMAAARNQLRRANNFLRTRVSREKKGKLRWLYSLTRRRTASPTQTALENCDLNPAVASRSPRAHRRGPAPTIAIFVYPRVRGSGNTRRNQQKRRV